jgi:uncharacterized repeat protein (TIGR01451 family)
MSGPHVSGLAALLISATPELAGQPDAIETIIEKNAVPLTSDDSCGTAGQVPNNTFGWGRIDALKSFQSSHPFLLSKTSSAAQIEAGVLLTYTLEITGNNLSAPFHHVVLTDTLPAHTTLITATLPHTFDGTTIRWEFPALEANASLSADLVVQVSPEATGTIDNTTYAVASADSAYAVHGAPLSIPVVRPYDFKLGEEQTSWAWPGEVYTYTQPLTNSGTRSDTYSLSFHSTQDWSTLESPSAISLAPGETTLLAVAVNVPGNASPGSADTATLTVTSQSSPLKPSAATTDTTLVYYPEFFPLMFRKPD